VRKLTPAAVDVAGWLRQSTIPVSTAPRGTFAAELSVAGGTLLFAGYG
jgi:hypothetical protein